MKWHGYLVVRRHDGSGKKKPGPIPKKANSIRKLLPMMADQNPSWGYGHIHGELMSLG